MLRDRYDYLQFWNDRERRKRHGDDQRHPDSGGDDHKYFSGGGQPNGSKCIQQQRKSDVISGCNPVVPVHFNKRRDRD